MRLRLLELLQLQRIQQAASPLLDHSLHLCWPQHAHLPHSHKSKAHHRRVGARARAARRLTFVAAALSSRRRPDSSLIPSPPTPSKPWPCCRLLGWFQQPQSVVQLARLPVWTAAGTVAAARGAETGAARGKGTGAGGKRGIPPSARALQEPRCGRPCLWIPPLCPRAAAAPTAAGQPTEAAHGPGSCRTQILTAGPGL